MRFLWDESNRAEPKRSEPNQNVTNKKPLIYFNGNYLSLRQLLFFFVFVNSQNFFFSSFFFLHFIILCHELKIATSLSISHITFWRHTSWVKIWSAHIHIHLLRLWDFQTLRLWNFSKKKNRFNGIIYYFFYFFFVITTC